MAGELDNNLMSIAKTARMLGVCRTTLNKWLDEGRGPPVYRIREGGRNTRRCRMADVKAWLRTRREGGGG